MSASFGYAAVCWRRPTSLRCPAPWYANHPLTDSLKPRLHQRNMRATCCFMLLVGRNMLLVRATCCRATCCAGVNAALHPRLPLGHGTRSRSKTDWLVLKDYWDYIHRSTAVPRTFYQTIFAHPARQYQCHSQLRPKWCVGTVGESLRSHGKKIKFRYKIQYNTTQYSFIKKADKTQREYRNESIKQWTWIV